MSQQTKARYTIPVFTARLHGPWTRVLCTQHPSRRPVFTGVQNDYMYLLTHKRIHIAFRIHITILVFVVLYLHTCYYGRPME